jgi:enoyl-CoA hydratase/carnithine racemase
MQARERLYLTADRDRIVREGDPKAAFLYAALGDEIPASAAERFGLHDGRLPQARVAKAKEPADPAAANPKAPKAAGGKQQTPAENKEEQPAENKEEQPAENKGS